MMNTMIKQDSRNKHRIYRNRLSGFSLVELSVVMVVIGILMKMGLGLIGPMMTRTKTVQAKQVVDAAFDSVVGFVVRYERLPDLVGTATTGFDVIVPQANDPFNQPLVYAVDNSFLTVAALAVAVGAGGASSSLCDETVASTGFDIEICNTDTCGVTETTTITDIAFMIWSEGADSNPQLRFNNGAIPASGDVSGVTSPQVQVPRPGDTTLVATGFPFDDIVRWITLDELKIKAGCGQGIGDPLRIVNTSLPSGSESTSYSATITAAGGIQTVAGNYRWCYEQTPAGSLTFTPTSTGVCTLVGGGNWQPDTGLSLVLSGSPSSTGTILVDVFLRDNAGHGTIANDNSVSKQFVITIDP